MNRFAILLAVLLFGCADSSSVYRRIASLHEGMTQQELISLLGKPHAINHQGALTTYEYVFNQPTAATTANERPINSYYVIVGQDGRVRSYGPN